MGRRVALSLLVASWVAVAAPLPPAARVVPIIPPRDLVESVELHLPPGQDPADLVDLVAVRRGQVLSRPAVRRSVERLFSTGRFSDVVVKATRSAAGLHVAFELSVPQRLVGLAISGQQVLSEEAVRRAVRLTVGEPYFPERVDEAEGAIARAYRERGYDHARVKTQVKEEATGVALQFRIAEGEPTRLAGLTLTGAPGLPLARIKTALGLRPGDVLDRTAVTEGLDRVKTLYRSEHFYQLRMADPSFESTSEGSWLTLPVVAGPRFAIRFAGQRSFSEDLLRQVMGYEGQETLDRGLLNSLARKVETFYRFWGFHEVRIRPREAFAPGHRMAALVFEVEEGPQLTLKEIAFEGNTQRGAAELTEWIQQRVQADRPATPGTTRVRRDPLDGPASGLGGPDLQELPVRPAYIFVEDAYRQAADALSERYHEEGFLRAKVALRELEVDVAPSVGVVRFRVDEGPLTRVKSVEVVNAPRDYTVPPLGNLTAGKPLRASVLEAARLELSRTLGRGGWLFSQVKVETPTSEDGTRADVRFEVDAGPRVRVGQIVVQGLEETKEALVRAHVLLKPAAVLDPEALFETQRRLVALGLFRQVTVRFLAPDKVESVKDVVVEVRERSRLSGSVSGGYSLADGPRVVVDAVYPNLFGQGLTLSGRGQVNYVGASTQVLTHFFDPQQLQGLEGLAGRGNISLQQQRIYQLLPTQVGARMDLIAERVLRPSYRFTRYAAVAGLNWLAAKWLSVSLSYEVEQTRVQASQGVVQLLPSLVRGDAERLRFPVGVFNLQTLAPSFIIDFRDNTSNPTKGALVSVNTEITKDMGATLTDAEGNRTGSARIFTFKAWANVTGYIPLGGGVTLAISARGGRIFRLDPESTTIAPKRFFLGGATSMRGFREDGLLPADRRAVLHDEVAACRALANPAGCTPSALALQQGQQLPSEGGELFTLGKVELRFPVFGAFALGLFGEVGNLWLSVQNYRPLDLRYVAGIGVRYLTPVGPLALDLGVNVVPDALVNETNPNVQFSVGLF